MTILAEQHPAVPFVLKWDRVYHTLFESLEGFIDLPERINLGDKPVGGIWLGLHPGLLRHRERDKGVDTLRLGVDLRAADRPAMNTARSRSISIAGGNTDF